MIDLGRAIQHPFEDKDWAVKLLIGAGVSLVPILNFAVNGYGLQVQRNTALGQDVPLPRWDDFSKHLTDGLKFFVIQLIYAIPILIVAFGYMMAGIVFGLSSHNVSASTRDVFGVGFIAIISGLTCLILLYSLVYSFIIPATYIQLARTGQISAAFHINEIMALIKSRKGDYFIVALTPLMMSIAFAFVLGAINIIPFVGLCVTVIVIPAILVINPYITIVLGHLYGQLMRS